MPADPPSYESQDPGLHHTMEMDKTGVDVGGPDMGVDATKTQLKVSAPAEGEEENTPVEEFSQKKTFFSRLAMGLSSSSTLGSGILGPWLVCRYSSFINRAGFYLSRLGLFFGAVFICSLLIQNISRSFDHFNFTSWVLLGGSCVGLLLMVLGLVMRWSPFLFLVFPATSLFVLMLFELWYFHDSRSGFLIFMDYPTGAIWSHFWLFLLILELLLFFFVFSVPRLVKIIVAVVVAYGSFSFILNIVFRVALESSWLGVGLLTHLPWFLQPAFLTLEIFLPVLLVLTLVATRGEEKKSTLGWLAGNGLLLLVATLLAQVILFQNRVPSLSGLFMGPAEAAGSVQLTDGSERLNLHTRDEAKGDEGPRHILKLTPWSKDLDTGQGTRQHYELAVFTPSNHVAHFFKKDDFILLVNGREVKDWKLTGNGPYQLSFSPVPPEITESTTEADLLSEEDIAPRVEQPVQGDAFSDSLRVVVTGLGEGSGEHTVEVLLDQTVAATLTHPPYEMLLATTTLAEGAHVLEIRANGFSAPFAATLHLTKSSVAAINFTHPSVGEFVTDEVPVTLAATPAEAFSKVELWLKDKILHSWDQPPYTWNWLTRDLKAGSYDLVVRASQADGQQVSAWVRVVLGEGALRVPGPGTRLGQNLKLANVVFILDMSHSMQDFWESRSKWESLRDAVISTDGVKGFLLMGAASHRALHDCRDLTWIDAGEKKFKSKLKNFLPRGVSPLYAALEEVMAKKPQKIIVLTDGEDSCEAQLPKTLATRMQGSTIPIDVITWGDAAASLVKNLQSLVMEHGGGFYTVNSAEDLTKFVQQAMIPAYELKIADRTILRAPAAGETQTVRPGIYSLRIPLNPPLEVQDIQIDDGWLTTLDLEKEGDQWIVNQEKSRKE